MARRATADVRSSCSVSWSLPGSITSLYASRIIRHTIVNTTRSSKVRGILEQHWNRALLDSLDTMIQYATSMTWKGTHPVVALVTTTYQTGVKLTTQAMQVV